MDNTLTITVGADISALEAAMQDAASAVDQAAGSFAKAFAKAGEASAKAAARIVQLEKQANDKRLDGEEQLNRQKLALGQESLAQFTAQENALAAQKYDADLKALQEEEAKGKIGHAQYLTEKAVLDQEYANRQQQIAAQAELKQRALDDTARQEFIADQEARLRESMAAIDEQYRTHQIDADRRAQLEQDLTADIQKQIDDRLEFDMEAMNADSAAYEALEKQKEKIDQQFSARHLQITDQSLNEEQQKWESFSTTIASSFGSAIKGMIFEHMTWQRAVGTIIEGVANAFLQMGEKILANWIANLIMQEVVTKSTTAESALGQISAASGVAGANMTASWAAAPWPLDMMAPSMGAAAAAEAASFGSLVALDVGAWDIPRDMPALLHSGEMVVPKDFASGLRATGGSGGGDTNFHLHYAPVNNMRDSQSLRQMLQSGSLEAMDWLRRTATVGSGLPMRPSLARSQ